MEETKTYATTRSVGIRYGLILSVISIAYFMILTAASIDMTQGVGRWASLIFYVALIVFAHKYYKENNEDSFMSYGQGLGITFWLSFISSVIYSVFFYIYVKFIDSSFIQMIKDKAIEDMQRQGRTEEQIEQGMKIASMFMSPESMFIFGLIGGVFMIMICGLIVTIFTQKKNPDTAI